MVNVESPTPLVVAAASRARSRARILTRVLMSCLPARAPSARSLVGSAGSRAPGGSRGSVLGAPSRRGRGGARGARSGARRGLVAVAATKATYASFDDMIEKSPVPVLVDFYATWCGPCQLLSKQVLPRLAAEVGRDKVTLVKIDTEKYPNIASKFKVEALPTIMLFKDGAVADRIEGLPDANQLTARLKYMLGA